MPVFIGPNPPPVRGPQLRGPPPRGPPIRGPPVRGPMPFPGQLGGPTVPTIPARPSPPRNQPINQPTEQTEQWAPGEPEWFFPSSRREWMSSCQRLGCSDVGVHCVFWGSLCPTSVRRTPCRCQRGCRVDTHFIPFGGRKVIDRCNNVCICDSRDGMVSRALHFLRVSAFPLSWRDVRQIDVDQECRLY
ncbi:hypothetical protein ACF0H5_001124 [Mactra antiquata]